MQVFDYLIVTFLLVVLGERLYERRFSRRAVRGVRKMEWSYTLLHSAYAVLLLATAVEYFLTGRGNSWGAMAAGLVLFVIALVVRLVAIQTLGRYWSLHLEIRKEHELVTRGIYQYVRHPAYLGIMLEVVAIPLVARAWYTLAGALVLYVPLLLLRWHREEREMIEKFGEQYVRYCAAVPAFVPWRVGSLRRAKENCP